MTLAMVRAAAVLALPTGVVLGTIAVTEADPLLGALGGTGLVAGCLAVWQLVRGRPNAVVINLVIAVAFGALAPFAPDELAVGLGTAILVLMVAGIPLLSGRDSKWYALVVLLAWLSHPMARHLIPGEWPPAALTAYVIQAAFLGYGVWMLMHLRWELARTTGSYRFLFQEAPVALWENDFSEVEAWLAELREQGVGDLRSHLTDHPAELRRGIGLVFTRNANPAAAALLGAGSPEDLVGPFPVDVIDQESERLFLEQFVAVWEQASGEDMEYRGLRLDGSEFQGILRWTNPMLRGGRLERVVTAVSDVTALREAQAEVEAGEARQRALLEALPDLLFLCAADGTYLEYHAAGPAGAAQGAATDADLYVPPEEFLGRRPIDVLPQALAEQMSRAITLALETSHVQTLEYELPISGRSHHWEMRVAPLRGRPEVVALVRDVTDEVRARQQLEGLVRSKDDFIAAISHELRTPLTGVIGYAHLLRSEPDELSAAERREVIESLVQGSSDLSNIVEDLLVAAKADLGRLEVTRVPINLRAQAAQVLEAWGGEEVGSVEFDGTDVRCFGDPARVRQVIRNLLANALRYGGDRVRVEITRDATHGRICVADDGEGLPPDEVEQAFLPYHRSQSRRGLAAALGIGLPLSRNLARLMGGELEYRRVEDETRFEIALPLLEPDFVPEDSAASTFTGRGAVGILGRAHRR